MKKPSIFQFIQPLSFAFALFSTAANAQVSYEFKQTVPINEPALITLPQHLFGTYSSDSVNYKYEVTEEGIFLSNLNLQAISRESIRESGKYEVRNEHIFGVTADSIPCVLQGEYYYFGVRTRELLAGGNSRNKLIQIDESNYVVNFFEEGGYVPMKLSFKGNELSIGYFNYDWDDPLFKKIVSTQLEAIEKSNMKFILLSPTEKEYQKIAKKIFEPFKYKFKKL